MCGKFELVVAHRTETRRAHSSGDADTGSNKSDSPDKAGLEPEPAVDAGTPVGCHTPELSTGALTGASGSGSSSDTKRSSSDQTVDSEDEDIRFSEVICWYASARTCNLAS